MARWWWPGSHLQGFERRGQPGLPLLGAGLPGQPRHPRLLGRVAVRGRTAAAALSSRPPRGSRSRRRGAPPRRHQSPAPPARSGCGRGGRAAEGGRFRRVPLSSRGSAAADLREAPHGSPRGQCARGREQRRRAGRGPVTSGRAPPFSVPRAPLLPARGGGGVGAGRDVGGGAARGWRWRTCPSLPRGPREGGLGAPCCARTPPSRCAGRALRPVLPRGRAEHTPSCEMALLSAVATVRMTVTTRCPTQAPQGG